MPKHMQSGHKQVYKDGKYQYEHRVKMEEKLGRKLKNGEHIHHKNGNPADNRLSNLSVVSKADHNKQDPSHHRGGRPKGSKNK